MSGSLSAGRVFAKDCDLPDPLDLADYERRPDLLAAAAQRRHADGWLHGHPRVMDYPKPSGGLRRMTRLDPIADVIYRQLVGRVVAADGALFDGVHNTRVESVPGGWRSVPWRKARSRYEEDLKRKREADQGAVKLDVREHYDTVSPALVMLVLNSAGIPSGAVGEMAAWLRALDEIPGCGSGLPTGPEGSAVLGTLALLPLDRALARDGYDLVRWSDDYVVPVSGPEDLELVIALAQANLERNGQRLNLGKCVYLGPGEGPGAVSQIDIGEHLVDPGSELEVLAWMEEPQGVTQTLGLLRRDGDSRGVGTLKAHRWILERFPRQSAAYLRSVSEDVEWEWVLDAVLSPTTPENAAAQLHLQRAVPRQVWGPEEAKRLFAMGWELDRRKFSPLANQCFATAGRSGERASVRQRRALEAAVELSDLDAQRGLLRAFERSGGVSRSSRIGLTHLRRTSPELAAATDWAAA